MQDRHQGNYVKGARRNTMGVRRSDGSETFITLNQGSISSMLRNLDSHYIDEDGNYTYGRDGSGALSASETKAVASASGGGRVSVAAIGGGPTAKPWGSVAAGGWFRYYNKSGVDLKNLQIYTEQEVLDNLHDRDKIKSKFGQIVKTGPNMQLVEWMTTTGSQIYYDHPIKGEGRRQHPGTYEKAIVGVRAHKHFIESFYDFKKVTGIGPMIHEVVSQAPFPFTREVEESNSGMHEHCFIFALERAKVPHDTLQAIKVSLRSIELPLHKLEMISKQYKLHLMVRYSKHTQHFPRKNSDPIRQQEPIKMGCLCDHFFLIERIPVTSHALKYRSPADGPDWQKIHNQRGDRTTGPEYIDSYKVIETMLKDVDKHLKLIPPKDLWRTIHYDKDCEITDLTFSEHEVRLVENKYVQPSEQEAGQEESMEDNFEDFLDELTPEERQAELKFREENLREMQLEAEEQLKKDALKNPKKRKRKREDQVGKNVCFDFETETTAKHEGYQVNAEDEDVDNNITFQHEEQRPAARKLLDWVYETYTGTCDYVMLIAHNAGYDIRQIMPYLSNVKLIERGKTLLRGTARYYYAKGRYIELRIQDSCCLIPMPLRKFKKAFKIPMGKEILPYSLYTWENIKKRQLTQQVWNNGIAHEWSCKHIGQPFDHVAVKKMQDEAWENAVKWGCVTWRIGDGLIDIVDYSEVYCKSDVKVLKAGWITFKKWMKEITQLNIDDYVSLASLSHAYMVKEGCFTGVMEVSGTVQKFIHKTVHGGKCCTKNGFKWHVKRRLQDFDCTSLYPAAMTQIPGYPIGPPSIITSFPPPEASHWYGEFKVMNVGKYLDLPLMCYRGENGSKNWSNDMIGKTVHMDKYQWEDAQTFQHANFKFIRGYQFTQGFNPTVKRVIQHLFDERKKKKNERLGYEWEPLPAGESLAEKQEMDYPELSSLLLTKKPNEDDELELSANELADLELPPMNEHTIIKVGTGFYIPVKGNPIEMVYKLLMNASYGKTMQKPIDKQVAYVDESKIEKYVAKWFEFITGTWCKLANDRKYKISRIKPINNHFNLVHCGSMILSMSKRIMARVTTTAQDLGVNIYYTDTDSLQTEENGLQKLSEEFAKRYPELPPLIGKGLGQFHNDYDTDQIKTGVHCVEAYFLGKKVYICKLHGLDKHGNPIVEYHIRCKGVNDSAIHHHTKNGMSLMGTYAYLFNEVEDDIVYCPFARGKKYSQSGIGFDLSCGGDKVCFDYKNDFTIVNRHDFVRNIKFLGERHIADETGEWINNE